ncbi:hypothetical protein AQUCO_01600219v1 [Aquilegia coerulea]|uniref:B box-type domain-containing protein n=1 Tax=Aquilegia coerulea TaxID=218851 RepID=A0A2G5DQM0_AQUCA|nr:hypothetical protein AQUCO_01600219v1 [Aquilegia coerulea]
MLKKECELCSLPAKTYCESDEASLCWNCDWKIHSANFLVAKHERSLLCHICSFPTQWKSSGSKLGSTLSICEKCVKNNCKRRSLVVHQQQQDESEGDNEDTTDDEEEDSEDEEDEDADNQVVPWNSTDQTSSSSCSNSEKSSSIKPVSMKRIREHEEDLDNQDYKCCSSSSSGNKEEEVTSLDCLRPLKQRKIDEEELILSGVNESESESDLLVQSLKKFHQKMLLVQ